MSFSSLQEEDDQTLQLKKKKELWQWEKNIQVWGWAKNIFLEILLETDSGKQWGILFIIWYLFHTCKFWVQLLWWSCFPLHLEFLFILMLFPHTFFIMAFSKTYFLQSKLKSITTEIVERRKIPVSTKINKKQAEGANKL